MRPYSGHYCKETYMSLLPIKNIYSAICQKCLNIGLIIRSFLAGLFFVCLLWGVILNVPASARAETDARSKVLDGFRSWHESVDTLHADFHQSTLNPLWGQEQEAKGEVWFKKPGQMRWEYRSPQKDIIIVNQEEFFWYVPEDNQVIKKKRKEAFHGMSPMSILGENMDLEKDFEVLGIEEMGKEGKNADKKGSGSQGYIIHLKPKMPQVAAKNISVEIKAKQFSLTAIEVEEHSGGCNRIEFDGIKVNTDLEPDLFIFAPLPGIKVITPKDFPAW